MKLINKSQRNYIAFDTVLVAGKVVEVKGKTAEILLKQPGVEEYVDIKDVKALEEENELNKLKVKALELGIKVAKNDTIEKLNKKIAKVVQEEEETEEEEKEIKEEEEKAE